ncbi:hypothetical protein QT972_21475 [Microcoleus sp. herbarium7]
MKEVRQRMSVTDLTDLTDVRKQEAGSRKKEEKKVECLVINLV